MDFTPKGTLVIHTDWDAQLGGATTGRVWARVVNYAAPGTPAKEVRGTEEEIQDWTFRVMAAAGEKGFAVELRDARG